MATYYIRKEVVWSLLGQREGARTFAPGPTRRLPWVDATEAEVDPSALAQPRAAQSPKGFFLAAAESVGRYGPQVSQDDSPGDSARPDAPVAAEEAPAGDAPPVATETQPLILVGVRACELRARRYLDKVMLEGAFEDPLYRQRRQETTVISCDCVDCTDSCFCTLVGGLPYATEGYDVNLTPTEGGMVVEVATERGNQWLGDRASSLTRATGQQLAQRQEIRQKMVRRLQLQNAKFTFTASDESQPALPDDGDDAWQAFAADCVECGACTHICPTCHCFYLYDHALGPEEFERIRTWDSCLLSTYHRMAGGVHMKLTPRPRLSSRLANRVLHKFTYSPQQYSLLGCVGCGRCVDACLGAIDIRQVVQELGK